MLLVLTRRMTPRRDEVDALAHAARGRGVAVRELELRAAAAARELEALVGAVATLDAPQRERVIAAADGNPLLALESARAAARGDRGPPASLRGVVRAAIAGARRARAPRGRARRRRRPRRSTALELAALAPPEDGARARMDCGLFHSADGRFGFRHELLREAALADLDDARRALLHETLGARAARARRPRPRATCASPAATTSRPSGWSQAAADAARATALVEAVAYLDEAVELRPDDPPIRLRARRACSPSSAAASRAMAELDAGARAAATRRRARPRPRAPARRAVVPQRAVRSRRARCRAAQHGLDALDAGGLDDLELRASSCC